MSEAKWGSPTTLSSEDLQEYANFLKLRLQFYREENAILERMFEKLKFVTDEFKAKGLILPKVEGLLSELEIKSMSPEKIELGQAERLRKTNHYLLKLKICIRHYSNFNKTILKHIKVLKSELDQSTQHINNTLKVLPNDIEQLAEKAKKYENELIKFEKKYPWLKQTDYDLPNIAKHFETLKMLKEQKHDLLRELSRYQDLKPDIELAKEQLLEVKEEMKMQ